MIPTPEQLLACTTREEVRNLLTNQTKPSLKELGKFVSAYLPSTRSKEEWLNTLVNCYVGYKIDSKVVQTLNLTR